MSCQSTSNFWLENINIEWFGRYLKIKFIRYTKHWIRRVAECLFRWSFLYYPKLFPAFPASPGLGPDPAQYTKTSTTARIRNFTDIFLEDDHCFSSVSQRCLLRPNRSQWAFIVRKVPVLTLIVRIILILICYSRLIIISNLIYNGKAFFNHNVLLESSDWYNYRRSQ